MAAVLVRVRVYVNKIGNDWGLKAEFQLHIKAQKGKLLSSNSEVVQHEVIQRKVVSDNKSFDDSGKELFDATLTVPGSLSDVVH